MKKIAAFSLIVVLPLLSSCETMQDIRDFKVSDYINIPWEKKTAEPTRTAEAAIPPITRASEVPAGLQRDDLRAPFGDNQTAVASR